MTTPDNFSRRNNNNNNRNNYDPDEAPTEYIPVSDSYYDDDSRPSTTSNSYYDSHPSTAEIPPVRPQLDFPQSSSYNRYPDSDGNRVITKYDNLVEQHTRLQEDYVGLKNELAEVEQDLEDTNQKSKWMWAIIAILGAIALLSLIFAFTRSSGPSDGDVAKLESQVESLTKERDEAKQEASQVHGDQGDLQNQVNDLTKRAEKAEDTVDDLNKQISQKDNEIDSLKQSVKEAEGQTSTVTTTATTTVERPSSDDSSDSDVSRDLDSLLGR